MEIAAKFGSAMTGFWWALDDHERRLLILAVCWLGAMTAATISARGRERELDELADRVAARLSNG